ncbi:MAG: L-histidine N(alpha)-methyltransferase [Candidatus Kariarchaeaceae archaeon]
MGKYEKLAQEDQDTAQARFAKDVFLGLMRTRKMLPSKYMYDSRGSEIYEKIMELPEYYLVKAEYDALDLAKHRLSTILCKTKFNMIELGAGNGYKTKLLLDQFKKDDLDFTYVPIDISEGAMIELVDSLNRDMPELEVNGLVADYYDALEHLRINSDPHTKNFVLFLGSNLGNFTFEDATAFIFSLWRSLNPNDLLLIGFDLRKDIDRMISAYNDPQGVTEEFNLNVLRRINNELGGNFDLDAFIHYEPYNVYEGSMESYLLSQKDQEVYIEKFGKTFSFKKWEPIFMEQSYKYTLEDAHNLAAITGFDVMEDFYDSNSFFLDSLWCVDRKIT